MARDLFVFLGPTLDQASAREILDATFLPPARMGDLYDVVARRQARAIGLIDGLFDRVPSVWHKEVLFALSRGVRVYGSSSMGALRAAELAAFGMEGIGEIFEAFRSGRLEDDDEVAVTHGTEDTGFRVLSEAMVNLRHGLQLAQREGIISSGTAQRLEAEAKALFYPDRSWQRLFHIARSAGVPADEIARLEAFVREARPDLKRADAMALLRRMADDCREGVTPHVPGFELEPTVFWNRLVSTMHRPAAPSGGGESGPRAEELHGHLRVSPDRPEVLRGALLLHLVELEAKRLGLTLDRDRLDRASEAFRRRKGLLSADATHAWMRANDVTQEELGRIVRIEALIDLLCEHHGDPVSTLALTELKRRGAFAELAAAVSRKNEYLRSIGLPQPTLEDLDVGLPELIKWYQKRVTVLENDLSEHSRRLRFGSPLELIRQLAGDYLYAKSLAPGQGPKEG